MGRNQWNNMTFENRYLICKKCLWNNRTSVKLAKQDYDSLPLAAIGVLNYTFTGVKTLDRMA